MNFASLLVGPMTFVAAMLLFGGTAHAGATLTPSSASAGESVDLTFHVVNTQGNLLTNKVVVTFPESPAVSKVSATSPAGWSSTVDASTGNVATVEFGSGDLRPGASVDFVIAMVVPSAPKIVFQVQQFFDNGSSAIADPATLTVSGVAATTTTMVTSTTLSNSATSTTVAATTNSKNQSASSSIGKVLLIIAVVAGVFVYARSRKAR